MEDGSSKKPYGVVEDVMVCVGKLKLLLDFVVMEMEENLTPIILRRPFMKTAKVIINLDEGMTVLQDQEERVVFNVFKEEQQMQKEEASRKATCQDVPMTSFKAAKPGFKGCERIEKERQFGHFKDIFNQLEVDLLLNEALQQIPAFVKHMKPVSTKKRFLDEEIDECKAIKKKPLPPKVKDPGSFTIPCIIGKEKTRKALLDLGSSVNLMPLSLFE
ncbi:uncharacterized protein LOC124827758 [Vigna umbellata]|uniref:uncharacterized protein LOC124827758 n=1 Tax=Vigna umbellata TaxID=87088 RepID=UPI001F5E5666|nr:uncharacterized protein LOC124827758 [Vigna umbellata]